MSDDELSLSAASVDPVVLQAEQAIAKLRAAASAAKKRPAEESGTSSEDDEDVVVLAPSPTPVYTGPTPPDMQTPSWQSQGLWYSPPAVHPSQQLQHQQLSSGSQQSCTLPYPTQTSGLTQYSTLPGGALPVQQTFSQQQAAAGGHTLNNSQLSQYSQQPQGFTILLSLPPVATSGAYYYWSY